MPTCYPLDCKKILQLVQISPWNINSHPSILVFSPLLAMGEQCWKWMIQRFLGERFLTCSWSESLALYGMLHSFRGEGTWYHLNFSGLRVAATTLHLLWPTELFQDLRLKSSFFSWFIFDSSHNIMQTLFIPSRAAPSAAIMNTSNVSGLSTFLLSPSPFMAPV